MAAIARQSGAAWHRTKEVMACTSRCASQRNRTCGVVLFSDRRQAFGTSRTRRVLRGPRSQLEQSLGHDAAEIRHEVGLRADGVDVRREGPQVALESARLRAV